MIVLEELDTEFGTIKIVRSTRDGTYTYYQDSCCHSQANTEGVSTCAYVHVMYSIIKQAKAQRILMIGCAGGSLATMLDRLGCVVTVIDINPHAFTLAKRYFQMPDTIQCIVGDGWSYILETENHYDAIAVDAFKSNGTIPDQFTSEVFFQIAKEALGKPGIIVMNVMIDNDLDLLADQIAVHMEQAEMPAILFDRPGWIDRNTIVACGLKPGWIPSGNEPSWIRQELRNFQRREANKNAVNRQVLREQKM